MPKVVAQVRGLSKPLAVESPLWARCQIRSITSCFYFRTDSISSASTRSTERLAFSSVIT